MAIAQIETNQFASNKAVAAAVNQSATPVKNTVVQSMAQSSSQVVAQAAPVESPAQTSAAQTAVDTLGLTAAQIADINSAVSSAANNLLPGGTSAGGYDNAINSTLGGDGFNAAQIAVVQQGEYNAEPHGVGFFEQGNISASIQSWTKNILNAVNGYTGPSQAVAAAPAPAVAAVQNIPTPEQVNTGANAAPSSGVPVDTTDPTTAAINGLTSTIAALQALVTPPATTVPDNPVGNAAATTVGSATSTTSTSPNAADLASQILAQAGLLSGGSTAGVAGSGSVAGGVASPDPTTGVTPLTSVPTTTTGPDWTVVGVVVGIIALGFGVWAYYKDHHKGAKAAAAGGP